MKRKVESAANDDGSLIAKEGRPQFFAYPIEEEVRRAFDLRLYAGLSNEQARQRMIADTVSLFGGEASGDEFYKRVYAYTWSLRDVGGERRIVCPEYDPEADVRGTGKGDEQLAFNALAEEFLVKQGRWMGVWISAVKPGVYPESRLVVMTKDVNEEKMQCLGISVDWDESRCEQVGKALSELADKTVEFDNVDELRRQGIVIAMPEKIDRCQFLGDRLPELQEVWNWVKDGGMARRQTEIRKNAADVVDRALEALKLAKNEWDYVLIGAHVIERPMAEWHPVQTNTGCGKLNMELMGGYGYREAGMVFGWGLGSGIPRQSLNFAEWTAGRESQEIVAERNYVIYKGKLVPREIWNDGVKKYWVFKCGNCKVPIEAHIPAKFKCKSCGGVYEGC